MWFPSIFYSSRPFSTYFHNYDFSLSQHKVANTEKLHLELEVELEAKKEAMNKWCSSHIEPLFCFWKIPKKGLERSRAHCNSNIECDTSKVYFQVGSLLSRTATTIFSFSFWYLEWKWELDPWYSTCMYCGAESTREAWPRYQAGKWLKGCQKMQMWNYRASVNSSTALYAPWTSSFMHLISSDAHFTKGRKNHWFTNEVKYWFLFRH